jgi:hypothetical protein
MSSRDTPIECNTPQLPETRLNYHAREVFNTMEHLLCQGVSVYQMPRWYIRRQDRFSVSESLPSGPRPMEYFIMHRDEPCLWIPGALSHAAQLEKQHKTEHDGEVSGICTIQCDHNTSMCMNANAHILYTIRANPAL